jgi:predicted MPP superfamily phosphohydrolase
VTAFAAWLCVLDAGFVAAGAVLAWRLRWRSVRREVAAAAAFAVPAAAAFWIAGWRADPLMLFSELRATCHLLFCVLLPVLALRALRVWRRAPALAAVALLVALAGEGCYLWAREVEPFWLEITRERVTSRRLHGLDRPLRIAAVSDLQPESIGSYEVSVFDALVAGQPDLVVFLGDTLQWYRPGAARQRELLQVQLRRLSPRLGMFAVVGDVEGDLQATEEVFAGTGVRVLEDATAALPGVPIDVIGLSRARSRRPAIDVALARQLRGERFPVVIGHAPDYMRCVLDGGLRADALFLAGHTHGGQVQIPFFGPLVTLSSVPRWLAAGGVFRRGDAWLAVTRGLGMEGLLAPRIRFWCRPQILVLDLAAPPG